MSITAHLLVDGTIARGPTPSFPQGAGGGSANAFIGGDLLFDELANLANSPLGFGIVGDSVGVPTGTGPNSVTVDLDAAATFQVDVGDTFLLGFRVGLVGISGFEGDLANTATVSFDLPGGISLVSQNGFGASAPAPNVLPASLAGCLALCAARTRRRRGGSTGRG